jgi:hypothetical protein
VACGVSEYVARDPISARLAQLLADVLEYSHWSAPRPTLTLQG